MKYKFLFFTMVTGFFARSQIIDSVVYSPQNPTVDDTLTILCYVQYPNIGCPVQEKEYYYGNNNSIILKSLHCGGMITMICYTVDTFIVPMPKYYPGTYTIYYMPGFITDDSNCTFPIFWNGDTIPYPYAVYSKEITVSPSVSLLQEFSWNPNYKILITPNPFSNQFTITIPSNQTAQITIYNIYGETILHHLITQSPHHAINLSNHPPGIYFLKANINGQSQTFKLIKI